MAFELRQYQTDAIQNLRSSIGSGKRAPLFVLPTGGGKSAIACAMIESATQKKKNVLFLAPRRQLIYQISQGLDEFYVEHGVIMAGEPRAHSPLVSVASVDTLFRRLEVKPKADLIIIDEAHCVFGDKARKILAGYPDAIRIGLTATPARSDGKGLGELYDDLILGPSMVDLISQGALVPCRYFVAPEKVDLSKVKITAGDYNQGELSEVMEQPKLVGDIVKNWQRICPDRQTVVFAVKRSHALALQKEFEKAGVATDYIDGETNTEDRKQILKRIESGESRVLCSVDVLSYGWNSPAVSCAVMARPTKSVARYLQAVGRVLRPYPGKVDAILIDHGNVVKELGFVDDEQPWSLEADTKIQDRKEEAEKKEPKPIECPTCHRVIKPAPKCPHCGTDLRVQYAKAIAFVEAELRELEQRSKEKEVNKWTREQKQLFYREMLYIARSRGYKDGWAANKYRERVGVWPRGFDMSYDPRCAPRDVTAAWVKHSQIKWAKEQEAKTKAMASSMGINV